MADSFMGKAATMEIPINSNGETLAEDDSLEQAAKSQWTLDEKDLQQVMVSGPNLNETSIVSGGYGGPAGGIIPTSSIKGPAIRFNPQYVDRRRPPAPNYLRMKSRGQGVGLGMHHSNSNQNMSAEEANRGVAVEKLDSVKKWGINTYKCTKQMFSERFGRGSRTVDLELEAQIDVLRDTKRKYESVLRLTSALTSHFYNMVQTQQSLGDTFADLSQKSPELRALLGAINFFVSSINTLVNKTMEDTLMTIKLYEAARADLEELSLGPRDAATMVRIEVSQQQYQVKVMHKQLLLFHNAISAYFAGNQQQLEQTLRQFNVKLKPPGSDKPSWLEES
ncbi:unnamed protein product [Coregonus sp. 'balchen']|nr:unnamed protein product [Coregonus sp. 'balchen']